MRQKVTKKRDGSRSYHLEVQVGMAVKNGGGGGSKIAENSNGNSKNWSSEVVLGRCWAESRCGMLDAGESTK
jgi:hypothetical protein